MLADIAHIVLSAAEEIDHAEEPTGLDLILPALPELIGGALAFLVVLLVLNKFAFPRIKEGIKAREDAIQSNLEGAEAAKAEAQRELDAYKAQVADARSEANRIVEQGRAQAEQVRKDIVAKAEKDAEAIVARAQEQIHAERDRAVQELQSTVAELSIELAEKIVGRSLDAKVHREFVDAYIKDVAALGSNGGGK